MNDSALSQNNQLEGAGAAGRRANRTRFSKWQVKTLQEFFDKNAHPNEDDSKALSDKLNLSLRVIAVWFQNARQKARKIYDTLPGECEDRTPELSNRHINGSTQAFSLGSVKLDTTMDTQPKDPQMQQHQSFIAPPLNLDSNVVEKSESSSAAATLDNSPASKISLKRSFMESPKIVQSEAAKLRSESFKKRQLFNEYTKACGRNSLRAKLTKTEFDYETLFDLDHRYSIEKNDGSAGGDETLSNANRSFLDAATSTNNKPKRFCRELFFSQYSRLASGEAEVLLNDLDVVEENAKKTSATSGKLHQTTCPTPSDRLDDGGEDAFKESEKCAEKLKRIVAYFEQVPSSNDDESSSQSSTSGNKVDDNDKSIDWQEKMKQTISKQVGWKVLEKITKVLSDELLVILATVGRSDKTNIRENTRNKNASRLRLAFVDVIEDQTLLQSIHSTLVQHLPLDFLATYVELLKILKAKTPDVVSLVYESDLKSNQNLKSKAIRSALEEYFESRLASNAVDIVDYSSVQIAKNPIFVLFSPALRAFGDNYQPPERCQQFYRNLLPQIGKCFEIKFLPFKKDLTMFEANEKLFDQAHEKLMEIMKAYPTRHIVLVGWDASCLVAAMLTLHYPVAACVCFSFPNVTLNGLRGDVDDDILNITCPVLFVVGQFSSTCSLDDLRDTNEHMSSKNVGLIVVGGANNELKVSHNKLCMENVTQRIVDKCILDNVAEFLNDVLIVLPDVFCTPEEQAQEIVS